MSKPARNLSQAPSIMVLDEPVWLEVLPNAATLVRRPIRKASIALRLSACGRDVTVLLTTDAEVRELNARWRGLDKPTNVLSFPSAPGAGPKHLGDIAIAYETAAREAAAEGKPLAHHLSHLTLHGFLHLVGYDHETDTEAEKMERLERDVLASLGIPDPYATPDNPTQDLTLQARV